MADMSFRMMTRLTGLLEEVRAISDLVGIRQINEYIDGAVRATGRYEYFCWHCRADHAGMPSELEHESHCLLARIDVALKACQPDQLILL